jgi:hypothetical protein
VTHSAVWAVCVVLFWFAAAFAQAEDIRFAVFNAELTRRNPGLLVRDLMKGNDPQIAQVVGIIQAIKPDILLLSGTDFDAQGIAISLLRDAIMQGEGVDYPYWFIAPVNSGVPSGLDLDGDGRLGTANDAWGFGYFSGQKGMAVLSRFPVALAATRTFQNFRWIDLPGADLPLRLDGTAWPSDAVQAEMRLSSAAHWDVVIDAPGGPLHVLAASPTPPVFDGPEDANGRRNNDELAFWLRYLEGGVFEDDQGRMEGFASQAFVVLGDFNADPVDGESRQSALKALLAMDVLQDAQPESLGAVSAAALQGGANIAQRGNPALDTADWPEDVGKPGNMRVDFVLSSVAFKIVDAGVFWPLPEDEAYGLIEPLPQGGARHRLVWLDVSR